MPPLVLKMERVGCVLRLQKVDYFYSSPLSNAGPSWIVFQLRYGSLLVCNVAAALDVVVVTFVAHAKLASLPGPEPPRQNFKNPQSNFLALI